MKRQGVRSKLLQTHFRQEVPLDISMNSPPLFSVEDSVELNALLRALLQAKFRPAVPDTDLPCSRYMIAMIERVFEASRNVALASGNPALLSSFDTLQKAEQNPLYVAAARARLQECPAHLWAQWSREERLHFVRQILSPLRAEPQLLEYLLHAVPEP